MDSIFKSAVNVKFCEIEDCEFPLKCFCHDCCMGLCFRCSKIHFKRRNSHRIVLYRERAKIRSKACGSHMCLLKGPCMEVCCFTCRKVICDSSIEDHEFHYTMTTSEQLVYFERMINYLRLVRSKIRNITKFLAKIEQGVPVNYGRSKQLKWKMKHAFLTTARYNLPHLTDIKRRGEEYIRLCRQMQDSFSLGQTLSKNVPNATFITAPNINVISIANPGGRPKKNFGPLLICNIRIFTKPFSGVKLFGSSDISVWVHEKNARVLSHHDICGSCRSKYILDMVPEFVTLARDHIVYVDNSKNTVYKLSSKGTQKLVQESANCTQKLMTESANCTQKLTTESANCTQKLVTESGIITAISSSSNDSLLVCTCNMATGRGEIRKYDISDGNLLQILASSSEFPFSFYDLLNVFSVTENIDGSVWFLALLDRSEVRKIVKISRCFTDRNDSFAVAQVLDNLRTICPMEITHNSRGDILILDDNKKEVHIVNKIGNLTWSWSFRGNIESICVDPSDKLWVADSDGDIKAFGCYRLCKPISRQGVKNVLKKYSKNRFWGVSHAKSLAASVTFSKHLKKHHNEISCEICSFSYMYPSLLATLPESGSTNLKPN
ncbi:uncharacterized protein LOC130050269 [Ostrea edulis]|uniref:uncharacterized protein LOC130050269 n=1 Tax=Ostrea edulis TaxID=37623 RepID=UPI0024AEE546|nr:uncharacterized protein LOC130050269 [Ostrea edulis]